MSSDPSNRPGAYGATAADPGGSFQFASPAKRAEWERLEAERLKNAPEVAPPVLSITGGQLEDLRTFIRDEVARHAGGLDGYLAAELAKQTADLKTAATEEIDGKIAGIGSDADKRFADFKMAITEEIKAVIAEEVQRRAGNIEGMVREEVARQLAAKPLLTASVEPAIARPVQDTPNRIA